MMLERKQSKTGASRGAAGAPRMANLEALRCVAMMMVVVLHFLGKGNLLGDVTSQSMGGVGVAAWMLESFCIVAVNTYMLISGYFLSTSSFKLSRLVRLYLQIWFYSVGVGMLAVGTGLAPSPETAVDTHYYLSLLFPVSMGHYWFMTAYVFLYLLLPFVGRAVQGMDKRQMQIALGLLLLMFCVCKSVLPFRLETDGQGYDCLWYLCVFLTAAYLRKFGISFLQKKWHCALLYVLGCLGVLAELLCLRWIYLRTGSLGLILKISTEYNHVLTLAAAVGLFGLFLQWKSSGMGARLVTAVAPYTLGVYLLHENVGVRYVWQRWFGAGDIASLPTLLGMVVLAAFAVFSVGVAVDFLRSRLMGGIHRLLLRLRPYQYITSVIYRVDEWFRRDDGNTANY